MFEKVLEFQARLNPDNVAFWLNGGEITYGMMALNVAQFTTAFALEKLPAGGIALLDIPNPALFWIAALALERLGHPTVCARADAETIALIEPPILITTREDGPLQAVERVVLITDTWRKAAFSQQPSRRQTVARPDDLIRIVLSSGTTGTRKQIPLIRSIVDERVCIAPTFAAPSPVRFLLGVGMNTISGFARPLTLWAGGATFIVASKLDEEALIRSRPTFASLPPILLKSSLEVLSNVYRGDRRLMVSIGGSAMPPSLLRAGLDCEGLDLLITYGSTEAGNTAMGPARLALERPGAVGYVSPWAEVEMLGPNGETLGVGQTGEIRIRSASAAGGYRSPGPGASQFRDGWFHPGDPGRIDEDGVMVIDGRIDDVINLGGAKFSSTQIEDAILDCRGVDDAAVVAFPMDNGAWTAFVAVVSKTGFVAEEITRAVHHKFGFNIRVVPLAKIERNDMGKIVRAKVREAIIALQGAAGVKSN